MRKIYQVVELAMDIADDSDGCRDVNDVGLAHQDLLRLFADLFEKRFAEQLLLEKRGDTRIEIESHIESGSGVACTPLDAQAMVF